MWREELVGQEWSALLDGIEVIPITEMPSRMGPKGVGRIGAEGVGKCWFVLRSMRTVFPLSLVRGGFLEIKGRVRLA